jgi:CheY-like chemotaxis protein
MQVQTQNRRALGDGRFGIAGSSEPQGRPGSSAASGADHVKRTTKPRRVLLIEDNIDTVRSLAFLLSDMGHKVEYAINGYAGIEIARRFLPEFVLLDIGLPGMDGFDVCSRIKREPGLERTRVIAVTAWAQDEYRVRSRAVGCELHLVKPVPVRVLQDLLG